MYIGEVEVLPVLDGQFVFAEPQGFPPKDSPEFAPHRNYITDDGLWLMDIGAFIVRTGNRVMLIDAGAGQGESALCAQALHLHCGCRPAAGGLSAQQGTGGRDVGTFAQHDHEDRGTPRVAWAKSWLRLASSREDVTDVVLSHLHWDHIGWTSAYGKPYFPNATLRAERRDIEFFIGAHPHDESFSNVLWNAMPAEERLGPVLDRFEPWDGDSVIAPGVNAMFAPGHTPGSCLIVLSSGAQRAMILGDTAHCPLELMDPEFSLMADMDQAMADRTRTAIRREMDGGHVAVAAPHFPGLQFGRLLPGEGKMGWIFEAW